MPPAEPPRPSPLPGTVPGARDTVTPPPAAEPKPSWVDKWEGSQIFTQIAMHPNVVAPDLQQTRNATVDTAMYISPRFALSKDWQLRGNLPLTLELTDTSATTTTRAREPRAGNPNVALFYRGIAPFWKAKLYPIAAVSFPLSPESQAQTMIVAPSLGFQLSRPFEGFLGGSALVILSGNYQHPLYRYTTPQLTSTPGYEPQCFRIDAACVEQIPDASANASDVLQWQLITTASWGDWSPGALFRMTYTFPYTFANLPGVSRLPDRTALRNATGFVAWIDYSWNQWLTSELGYQLYRASLDANGSYGNPIFAPYQDGMRFYLGVNVGLDALYRALHGGGGPAGVVRARAAGPVVTF
jgi:hypothetical protein